MKEGQRHTPVKMVSYNTVNALHNVTHVLGRSQLDVEYLYRIPEFEIILYKCKCQVCFPTYYKILLYAYALSRFSLVMCGTNPVS